MTAPAVAAGRLAGALVLGGALGVLYAFLRPLRPRHTFAADLVFILALFAAWLQLSFGICQGDLRMGYLAGLLLGTWVSQLAAEKLLGKVFSAIWAVFFRFIRLFTRPVDKFFKKFFSFAKKPFASDEKWVTIKWKSPRHFWRASGGGRYDRKTRSAEQFQTGVPAQPPFHQAGGTGSHRIVYCHTDDPADLYSGRPGPDR